jgi:hypothetical protein
MIRIKNIVVNSRKLVSKCIYLESVFLERIPFRLSNVKDIPFPDVLHVYKQSLEGFDQLSSKAGYFPVDEDQIGINRNGEVKVWLNTSF